MECLAAGRVMAMEISNPRLIACKNLGSTGSEMLRRPLTTTHLPVLSNNTSNKSKARPVFLRSRASASAVAVEPAQEIQEEDVGVPVSVPRLKEIYLQKVVPQLMQEFKYANPHQVPKIVKVVVNSGIGDAAQNAKTLEAAIKDLSLITGQRPVKTRAKKAVAAFKLRQGTPVGLSVTLRGHVMYNFLDRFMNLALPRTRDFQGVNPNSFDGHGNFSLGVREQNVFPEIEYEGMEKTRGMDVCIATSAKTDSEGQKLLSLLGMPFRS